VVELLVDELGAVLSVDAVLSERHELTARATQFPVEQGSPINDHITNEPRRVGIEGFVSDAPISGLPVPGLSILAAVLAAQTSLTPSRAAFDFLESLHDDRMAVTLITGLKRYEGMVMTSLTVPRDVGTGQALRFSGEFLQVRRVTTQVTEIPADRLQPGKPTEQGASELDLGKQAAAPVSQAAQDSLLLQIPDGVEGIFDAVVGP
jgi:hypothetical protein